MKSIKNHLTGLAILGGFIVLAGFIQAQVTTTSVQGDAASLTDANMDWSTASDLEVMLHAIEMTTPLPATAAPDGGNFYTIQHAGNWPPLPGNIYGLPFWDLGDGFYLLDDRGVTDYAALVQGQRQAQAMAMGAPFPDDGGDSGGTNGYLGSSYSIVDYGTNLWIRLDRAASNNLVGILSNSVADVPLELQTNSNLLSTNWVSAGFVYGSELTNWTAWSLPMSSPSNLFVRVRSWANDGSGLPLWWQLQYFGHTGVDPNADPVGDGWSNIQKFQNGMNPNVFYTPPAPQGLTASYNANNSTAFVSWLPSSGLVTAYTVQKHDSWTGLTTNYYFGTNISSFVDNVSADVPDPFAGDALQVSYEIQAHYGTNGDSYWGGPAPLQQNAISATIIAGPQGSAYLATSALPPGTVALRVKRTDEGFYSEFLGDRSYDTNFDIPVTNPTNGLYLIPPVWTVTSPDAYGDNIYYWFVRTVNTNGSIGAASLCSFSQGYMSGADTNGYVWRAAPYFDVRQQTKDNLRFLLRAATETPFTFQVVSSQYAPYIVTWPKNYAYADADALGSIWDNYFYRNFVFDQNHLTADGNLNTGCYDGDFYNYYDNNGYLIYESNLYITNQPLYDFNVDAFLAVSNPVVPSSLLTVAQSRWIRPQLSGDFGGAVAGGNNVYGLANLSVEDAAVVNGHLTLATYYPGNSIPDGGYRYLESAQPGFQTVEYDFWNSSPLPGNGGFATTNKSDLLITSVGIPLSPDGHIYSPPSFQVNAYARLAVTNGNSGVYGYLGQYFDKAYQIDNNGNVTTNTTGVLSPYGQFFATYPGPAALVTMPDIDTGQRGTCTVYCVSLALDKNHDGNMDLSWNGPDATSPNSPFVFWANNGNDGTGIGKDIDPEGQTSLENYSYGQIRSQRNLENFFRLWICGLPQLPASQGYTVTLSMTPVTGSPAINLYPAYESDGGTKYLTDTNVAALQLSTVYVMGTPVIAYGTALGTISSTQSYTLPVDGYGNAVFTHFLFEGAGIGEGQLTMTISQNGNTIAQTSTWLDIHDIKDFYDRAVVTNIISGPSSSWSSAIETEQYASSSALGSDTNLIVLVHGFFVGNWDWLDEGDTVFKRLYWAGFKGHFATVKWPCQTGDPLLFDLSELDAYKASTGVTTYMNQLRSRFPGYRLNILAHSQGNAVVSEAIRNQGLQFDTYILTQGAVPASSYNVNAPTNTTLLNAEFGHPTPDWQPMGYHGVYTNLTGNVVNFFNSQDWALNKWVANQFLKPDADYGSDGTNVWEYVTGAPNMPITDSEVSRAFVARSRSWAIGAQAPASGQTSEGVISSTVDLQAQFGFGNVLAEHSAEWTRPIQTSRPYYQQVLRSCLIQPAP